MGLSSFFCATALLVSLISSSATAQSPPAPFLPPSPAPAPAPHFVNLTDLLSVTGPFGTFLNYLLETKVIDTFQNQANDTKQGITLFVPNNAAFASLERSDLGNLTQDQLKSLLLCHAFPKYYSLSDFRNLSNSNPVSTMAGGQYTLNVTDSSGLIHVASSWSNPKIFSSVWATPPTAVYVINRVLLPQTIFSSDPPLAPAPAPAPETTKPSDVAPPRSEIASAPKSSESSTSGALPHSSGASLFNHMVCALFGSLILVL
ncbi:fasciclin-like arabinogalactan protein 7 [Zingiber officinale]|uniref:fasciclin-like arabinogalactan protein 7 n=1 Tax=Zingiber officinale TaxID=94328 RepID=UPI001C4C85D5|nr:fasciclin-like arabinogalactan protein 7 [Zingiber officinale]XP_042376160.1 fasciclin-like arabinogalactan protein 7 [Zingiber officinale]